MKKRWRHEYPDIVRLSDSLVHYCPEFAFLYRAVLRYLIPESTISVTTVLSVPSVIFCILQLIPGYFGIYQDGRNLP